MYTLTPSCPYNGPLIYRIVYIPYISADNPKGCITSPAAVPTKSKNGLTADFETGKYFHYLCTNLIICYKIVR